jgi:hypothetical protein
MIWHSERVNVPASGVTQIITLKPLDGIVKNVNWWFDSGAVTINNISWTITRGGVAIDSGAIVATGGLLSPATSWSYLIPPSVGYNRGGRHVKYPSYDVTVEFTNNDPAEDQSIVLTVIAEALPLHL